MIARTTDAAFSNQEWEWEQFSESWELGICSQCNMPVLDIDHSKVEDRGCVYHSTCFDQKKNERKDELKDSSGNTFVYTGQYEIGKPHGHVVAVWPEGRCEIVVYACKK